MLDRRALLTRWKDNLLENIGNSIKQIPFDLSVNTETKSNNEIKWFNIGKISDFKPNTNSIININEKEFILISNSTGFFAIDKETHLNNNKEPRYLIKIENSGTIMLNTFEFLPQGTVVSIMTGDFIKEEEEY